MDRRRKVGIAGSAGRRPDLRIHEIVGWNLDLPDMEYRVRPDRDVVCAKAKAETSGTDFLRNAKQCGGLVLITFVTEP